MSKSGFAFILLAIMAFLLLFSFNTGMQLEYSFDASAQNPVGNTPIQVRNPHMPELTLIIAWGIRRLLRHYWTTYTIIIIIPAFLLSHVFYLKYSLKNEEIQSIKSILKKLLSFHFHGSKYKRCLCL